MNQQKIKYFFIGPPRTATTWLHQLLLESHLFSISPHKQLNWFKRNRELDVASMHSAVFRGSDILKPGVDFGPDYFANPESIRKILQYNPDAKFIIIFRDPLERALSHYYTNNISNLRVFNEQFFQNELYYDNSDYAKHLSHLIAVAGSENILLISYDYLTRFASSALFAIFLHLGVKARLDTINKLPSLKVPFSTSTKSTRFLRSINLLRKTARYMYIINQTKFGAQMRKLYRSILLLLDGKPNDATQIDNEIIAYCSKVVFDVHKIQTENRIKYLS